MWGNMVAGGGVERSRGPKRVGMVGKKKHTHIKSDVKQKCIDRKRGVSPSEISSDHLIEKG